MKKKKLLIRGVSKRSREEKATWQKKTPPANKGTVSHKPHLVGKAQ